MREWFSGLSIVFLSGVKQKGLLQAMARASLF
jgi:hypothetical protein